MNTPIRLLLLVVCTTVLTSCSDYYQEEPTTKRTQVVHTSPTGQTTYTYKKADDQ